MDLPLPDGGVVRKLWVNETDAYRDHLLRLDRDSRIGAFPGTVSDDFIARHTATANGLGVVVHGFFIDGIARRRRAAPFGPMLRAKAKPPSASSNRGRATASARAA